MAGFSRFASGVVLAVVSSVVSGARKNLKAGSVGLGGWAGIRIVGRAGKNPKAGSVGAGGWMGRLVGVGVG